MSLQEELQGPLPAFVLERGEKAKGGILHLFSRRSKDCGSAGQLMRHNR